MARGSSSVRRPEPRPHDPAPAGREILREPGLAGAAAGLVLGWALLRDRMRLAVSAVVLAAIAYAILGAAGLPILTRYAFVVAAIGACCAAAGAFGWMAVEAGRGGDGGRRAAPSRCSCCSPCSPRPGRPAALDVTGDRIPTAHPRRPLRAARRPWLPRDRSGWPTTARAPRRAGHRPQPGRCRHDRRSVDAFIGPANATVRGSSSSTRATRCLSSRARPRG